MNQEMRLRLTRLRRPLRSLRTWISKPDGSCRRPIKDSKVLRNSGFPWVLGFLSYRSSLSYLHWLPGSLDCWLAGSLAPGRPSPRELGNGPARASGARRAWEPEMRAHTHTHAGAQGVFKGGGVRGVFSDPSPLHTHTHENAHIYV